MDDYMPLCEIIIEHCRQKHWYGPDQEYIYYDDHLISRPRILHDFRTGFFPPATEEQLRQAEVVMGFPYPSLLRTLYLRVANGGFGPGYGLIGTFDGYVDAMNKDRQHRDFIKEYSFEEGMSFIDLEQYERQHGDQDKIFLDHDVWPSYFILLCEWGCGYFSYLHSRSGHVYYVGEDYIYRQADSLKGWLECWLQGENLEKIT